MSKHDYGVSRWQLGDLSSPIRKRPDYSLLEAPSIIHAFYSKGKLYVHDIFLQMEKEEKKRSKVLTLAATIMTRYNNECTNLLLLLHTVVAAFNRTKYSERSRNSLEESEFPRRRCYTTQGKHDSKVL